MFSVTALSVVYRIHLPYVAKFLVTKILLAQWGGRKFDSVALQVCAILSDDDNHE